MTMAPKLSELRAMSDENIALAISVMALLTGRP